MKVKTVETRLKEYKNLKSYAKELLEVVNDEMQDIDEADSNYEGVIDVLLVACYNLSARIEFDATSLTNHAQLPMIIARFKKAIRTFKSAVGDVSDCLVAEVDDDVDCIFDRDSEYYIGDGA